MFETTHVAGGRLDAPHYPTFQIPFIVGEHTLSLAGQLVEMTYVVPFYGELYAISIDCEKYQNDDNWDMYVNGVLICERIYVKRAPEGVNLMAFIPVAPGQIITVKYRNMGAEKDIWCSLHFLKEGMIPLPTPIPPAVPPSLPPGGNNQLPPVSVKEAAIRLYMIDAEAEDGDIVDVYLNGAILKKGWLIKHEAAGAGTLGVHYIELPLQVGENLIIFEGQSAGSTGELSGKFKIKNTGGAGLYEMDQLPSLYMDRVNLNEPGGMYNDPKPQVHWSITRTV